SGSTCPGEHGFTDASPSARRHPGGLSAAAAIPGRVSPEACQALSCSLPIFYPDSWHSRGEELYAKGRCPKNLFHEKTSRCQPVYSCCSC
ncbi:MAG TPA: hypothetical protein PKA06_12615, partial [Gemmatales bacterium]|nr:hypothetical protein [Gemmatales bacterium]